MVADGDHFAVDDDSADTASGHAATPDPPRARVAERMKPPAPPGGGLRHRLSPCRSMAPPGATYPL
jgi:hypothetical protein